MLPNALPGLIDGTDTSEDVRDQIAAILAVNASKQSELALAANERPELYSFDVYTERARPWEVFLNEFDPGTLPIVNVSLDNLNYSGGQSDTVHRQTCVGRYNVDCLAAAISENNADGGHIPGDYAAALAAQRCYRQVRSILMAAENTYLQMRGTVGKRWPESMQMLNPPADNGEVVNIVGARLVLRVEFNEFSPQFDGVPLEIIGVTVERSADGKILLQSEYDYTSGA